MSRRKAITKSSSTSSSQAFSYSLYTSNLNRASGTVYSRPSTQQILRFLNQDIYYKALVSRILSLSVVLDVSTVCLIIPTILAQSVITITSYADISIIQRTIFIVYTTQATSSSIGQYRCLVGISIFKRNRISSTIFQRGIVVNTSYRQVALKVVYYYSEPPCFRYVRQDIQTAVPIVVYQYYRLYKYLLV